MTSLYRCQKCKKLFRRQSDFQAHVVICTRNAVKNALNAAKRGIPQPASGAKTNAKFARPAPTTTVIFKESIKASTGGGCACGKR